MSYLDTVSNLGTHGEQFFQLELSGQDNMDNIRILGNMGTMDNLENMGTLGDLINTGNLPTLEGVTRLKLLLL